MYGNMTAKYEDCDKGYFLCTDQIRYLFQIRSRI